MTTSSINLQHFIPIMKSTKAVVTMSSATKISPLTSKTSPTTTSTTTTSATTKELCWSCQHCVKERRFSQVSNHNIITVTTATKKNLNKNLKMRYSVADNYNVISNNNNNNNNGNEINTSDINYGDKVNSFVTNQSYTADADLKISNHNEIKNENTNNNLNHHHHHYINDQGDIAEVDNNDGEDVLGGCYFSTQQQHKYNNNINNNHNQHKRSSSGFDEISFVDHKFSSLELSESLVESTNSHNNSITTDQTKNNDRSNRVGDDEDEDAGCDRGLYNNYSEDVFIDQDVYHMSTTNDDNLTTINNNTICNNNNNHHTIIADDNNNNNNDDDDDDDCLNHVYQILACHPMYYECFTNCHRYVLYGHGPLPHNYRHYIAIMAASRHTCTYLVTVLTNEYLVLGGNPDWLEGVQKAPPKLRNLNEMNSLMAHRPWLLNYKHMQRLISGDDEKWTISELGHALVILAHFHSLASFVSASGVNIITEENVSNVSGAGSSSGSEETDSISLSSDIEVESIIERMKKLHETSNLQAATTTTAAASTSTSQLDANKDPPTTPMQKPQTPTMTQTTTPTTQPLTQAIKMMTPEELLEHYENIESQSSLLSFNQRKNTHKKKQQQHQQQQQPQESHQHFSQYSENIDFQYEDVVVNRNNNQDASHIFQIRDYSWQDQGYCLSDRLYPEIGQFMDDRFNIAQFLTYNNIGSQYSIDTSKYRQAIWNFVQSLFHIRHDDYDYAVILLLLDKKTRTYVKTVACRPQNVNNKLFEAYGKELRLSEKIHINVMIMEARMQAEMLYALKAVSQYMTH